MDYLLPLFLFTILTIIFLSGKKWFISRLYKKEWKGIPFTKTDYFLLSILSHFPKKTVIHRKYDDRTAFPISNEELLEVMEKVFQRFPLAASGISNIYIKERPSYMRKGVRGSYKPNLGTHTGDIYLYTFPKRNGCYLHGYTDEKTGSAFFIPANEQLTKYAIINTFLHEIAHHYYFHKKGLLNGETVESFCDQFSMKLAIELNITPGIEEVEKMVREEEVILDEQMQMI